MSDTQTIIDLLTRQNELLEAQLHEQKLIRWEARTTRLAVGVLQTAATAPVLAQVQEFVNERQMNFLETVDYIAKTKQSFTRFGDGEMQIMLRPGYNLAFQKNSPELAAHLQTVARTKVDGLLVGFPHMFRDANWSKVWADLWSEFRPLIDGHHLLGNAHVTRPYFFGTTQMEGAKAWRSVWEGQSITVVTGKDSRFEFIPELFDSAGHTRVVESLPKDAFDDVPRLLQELSTDESDLVLIALGPAGTVLTYELARLGRWAIDVGHINASYRSAFSGGASPENLPVARG